MAKILIPWIPLFMLAASSVALGQDQGRVVYESEVDADIEAVWDAFTTVEGLQSWMAPLADIELRVGGKMRANYNPEGRLGDGGTIENTILAFDPNRMLALQATGFPEGFPFEEVARKTWSVFYFEAVAPSRTRITIVGLGYTEEEKSQEMRSFFAAANAHSLSKLSEALAKERSPE